MKNTLKLPAMALSAACVLASPAHASLVYNSTITVSAQGFGNAPANLTLQATGTESGCVGVNGSGGITFGTCVGDATIAGNGVTNTNGTGDMPNPLGDNQKYGIPTIGELGWTNANDIGILFNAAEPGGNSITINDITLKIYSATGVLLASVDNGAPIVFASTTPGVGSAGFALVLDDAQRTTLNGIAGLFNSTNRIALESTLTNSAGGEEKYTAFNLRSPTTPLPEPATWLMMMVGFAGIGLTMRKRDGAQQSRVRFS
jgi:hypothetical protein